MKVTVKDFTNKVQSKYELKKVFRDNEQLIRDGKNTLETDKLMEDASILIAKLEDIYFNQLPTVFIEYWIGYRKYADQVVKIGKQYFLRDEKMTKSRGYRSIVEVEEITEEMKASMLSDSYYY